MSRKDDSKAKANDAIVTVNIDDFTRTRDNVSSSSFLFFSIFFHFLSAGFLVLRAQPSLLSSPSAAWNAPNSAPRARIPHVCLA